MQATKYAYSHYSFFNKLCHDNYEQSELVEFIEKIVRIGESYIHYNYSRIKNLLSPGQNILRDLAIEAITPLFLKSNSDRNFIICDVIRNWDPPIKSEEDTYFFLNKIISNRIEQHISQKLRESDPLFSKLLNSVNYLIRSGSYNKINYLGKVYITEPGNSKIEWIVIDDHEFHKIPAYLFFDKKLLLPLLFKFIKSETNCFPAIPLNELIFRLKHFKQTYYTLGNSMENVVEQIEINETIDTGLRFVEHKLKTAYYEKDKLDDEEYNNFKKALNMVAVDLKNGAVCNNLYSYMHPHFEKLSKDSYQENYHNIFEYLVKLFKNKLAKELIISRDSVYSIYPMFILSLISLENELLEILIPFC